MNIASGALIASCNHNLSMIATPASTSAPTERDKSLNSVRKSLLPENKELSIGLHDTSRRSRSRRSWNGKVGGGVDSTDVATPSPCYTRLNEFKPSTIDPDHPRRHHYRKESLAQSQALKLPLKVPKFPTSAAEMGLTTRGRTRTRQLETQPSDVSDSTVIKHLPRRSSTLGMEIEGRTRHFQQANMISKDDDLLTDSVERISKRSGPNSKAKSQQSSTSTSPLRRPPATRSTSMRTISTAAGNDGAFFRGRSPTNQLLHHSDGFLDLREDSKVSLRRGMASSSGSGNDGALPGRRSSRNELSHHYDGSLDLGTDNKTSPRRAMTSLSKRKNHCDVFQDLISDSKVSNTSNDKVDFSNDDLSQPRNKSVARNGSDSIRLHQPRQKTPFRPGQFTRSCSMREISSSSEAGNDVALLREQSPKNELRRQSDGFLDLLGEERTVAFGAVHSRSISTSRRPPARRSSLPIPIENTTRRDGLFDPRKNRIRFFAPSEGCNSVVGRQADQQLKDSALDGQVETDASLVGLARFWSITDPDDETSH